MSDEELLSWLLHCPVCGKELVRVMLPKRLADKYCPEMHGSFSVTHSIVVFDLNPREEDNC